MSKSSTKRGSLARWLKTSEWHKLKVALRDPGADPDQTVNAVRDAIRTKFGEDSEVALGLDNWLGFLTRMPETSVGANPFFFVRSSRGREKSIHPEDPTHVVANVELTRRLFQFCYPDKFETTDATDRTVAWMQLLDFRALSPENWFVRGATTACPLMSASARFWVRQALMSPPDSETPAQEDSDDDGPLRSAPVRKKTLQPTRRLEPKSYGFMRMALFRAWRRLARDLELLDPFPRCEIYDRVWNASAREFETSFANPLPNSTWEARRPAFLGVPGFSSESKVACGTLCPMFLRGCLLDPVPPYQIQVSGTQSCLFPALFYEDFEDVNDQETLLLRISARYLNLADPDPPEDSECLVPRDPPPTVEPGFDFESSSIFESLRALPGADEWSDNRDMPDLLED